MIGLVITGIIAVSAIIVIPNLSYVNLLYMDQQQLRNIALDTLKTMLLDAGYPEDWGSYQDFTNSTVIRFGLALDDSSSFYVLDSDKVSRLALDNPEGHLGYDTIRDVLKLQGYGFNFQIIPPFKVIVNDKDFDGESNPIALEDLSDGFEVFVTYNDGSPISGASVGSTLLYVLDKDDFSTAKASSNTNALGKCTINISEFNPVIQYPNDISDFVIVLKVTVADVTTVTSSYMQGFHENLVDASIVGDNITLWIPDDSVPTETSEMRVENVIAVDESDVWNMYTGGDPVKDKITPGEGFYYWNHMFPSLSYDPPLFLIFNILATIGGEGGRQFVLFVGPRPNWTGSRVQAYGDPGGARGASSAVKIQRDVVIAGMTFIAELTLWKESP